MKSQYNLVTPLEHQIKLLQSWSSISLKLISRSILLAVTIIEHLYDLMIVDDTWMSIKMKCWLYKSEWNAKTYSIHIHDIHCSRVFFFNSCNPYMQWCMSPVDINLRTCILFVWSKQSRDAVPKRSHRWTGQLFYVDGRESVSHSITGFRRGHSSTHFE